MPNGRRFEATNESVPRDLAATLVPMNADTAEVAPGPRLSKELTRQYQRSGTAMGDLQLTSRPTARRSASTTRASATASPAPRTTISATTSARRGAA